MTWHEELASDFETLRELLNEHPEYGHMIVGPDISSPWRPPIRDKFLKEFLTTINGSIDGLTYHQYYMDNRQSLSKFYDPDNSWAFCTEHAPNLARNPWGDGVKFNMAAYE